MTEKSFPCVECGRRTTLWQRCKKCRAKLVAAWQALADKVAAIVTDPEKFGLSLDDGVLDARGGLYGGHLAEQQYDKVYLHSVPGVRRRVVKVTVTKYVLGSHFYVSIREDDNPFWDPVEQAWRRCWDDPASNGRSFCDGHYARKHFVQPHIDRIVAANFPPETHVVEYESLGEAVYGRDGD